MIPQKALLSLLKLLKEAPMKALRRCRDAFQASAKTHNETVYEMIAFIVAFYLELYDSPQKRNEFLSDAYWADKPQPPKEKNLIRLTAMYMVGATQSTGALYQQAREYTKVANYFIALGTEPEAIPGELRRKPIYKILDELEVSRLQEGEAGKAEEGRSRAQPKSAPTDQTATSYEDEDNNDLNDNDTPSQEPASRSDEQGDRNDKNGGKGGPDDDEPSSDTPKVKRKRYPFDLLKEVAFTHNGWFNKLCEMEVDEGALARIFVKRIADHEDGWKQWEITFMEDMT